MVQAYNVTKNDTTGYSPHCLVFGWHPRLTVDAYLRTWPGNKEEADPVSYAGKMRFRLQFAHKVAGEQGAKNAACHNERYDRKVTCAMLVVGDRILVRKVCIKCRQKLADRWEQELYLVIKIANSNIPVYMVKRESGKGSSRTFDRTCYCHSPLFDLKNPQMNL